ncbi:(Fe-S)-binding protein [Vibrio quintilis]|uniref:Anaerobic glycerol-3-phosphate dehydrogenase subunit C n=1 Tax=Vibrio quintilis TaxID=1117707 RepID=A0A1M7YWG6_9VIBR|nr:(Fe-S)-binding protein [Vibrio quintilis]SHO57060.1 Anaerobic glycerol-3-phosphate dehydrogenase subunit C [Vibrio quintilis]
MKKILDWSNYHDQGMGDAYADIPKHGENFAKAVSVCIRSGICQKPDNRSVMCPSFRISDNPDLSPGGRVQLLKQLLNDSDTAFLHDPQLAQSLDNCVSCKGCKRECENNLDMSAIKAEYLAQKRRAGYRSFRSWLFAEFPYLLFRFPFAGHLIRWRNRSPFLMKAADRLLGLNSTIPLPEPARQPYVDTREQQQRNIQLTARTDNASAVVLLIDSFTALFHPEAATDALRVLTAAGYQVITLHPASTGRKSPNDSGRSLFSQGYIERATQQAAQLLDSLRPHLQANRKIIGLEPSALLMLRDEYLMMHLGEAAISLAKQALLFEEFIARASKAGRFQAQFKPLSAGSTVLVHGHCHQKAVGAMKSVRKVLRLIPDLPFQFIEASCCGMAGSYGFESEHAYSSAEMAALGLLPGLDADPDALVVCNGFSCNHQIVALRNRQPIHLATLLARQLLN